MGRKNIFDIMNEKNDVDYQIKKIDDLLSEMSVDDGTLEDIIDEYCIKSWKARGRYTSCEEIRNKLQITDFFIKNGLKGNKILLYLEYVSNLIWLCNERFIEKQSDYDDEYEYVDEYPRFRPGRIILGIISLLAFGFCIYKGFVTGLSTSGADVTSAPGMNYVIVALCMLITALLYFIMNNRDTLFAFLIPMIVYIGSAVFAFLKHGDEFELLILAGASGVLAVISLILAIASRGGDDYDDEDDYDDPFEEEHDN